MSRLRNILFAGACLLLFLPSYTYGQDFEEFLRKGASYYRQDQLDSSSKAYERAFASPNPETRLKAIVGWVKASVMATDFPLADSLIAVGETISRQAAISPPGLASFLLIKGEYHRRNSQFAQALNQQKQVISMAQKLADDSLTLAEAHYYAALTYEKIGIYDTALNFVEKAYHLYKTQMDTTDVRFSSIYNGMGACYFRANQLDKAKKYYLLSRSIAEQKLGPLSSDLALCLSNLSGIYRAEENYQAAIQSSEEALKIFRYLKDEAGISGAYYGLGVYHYYLGDYGRARDYLQACVEIRQRLYHPQHYSLIGPYQVLGIILEESGNYEQSLAMIGKVHPIISTNYGEGSLTEGFNHENRAISLKILGELDSALHYIQLAQRLLTQKLSSDDYSLAINAFNHADILFQMGRLGPARQMLSRSNRICESLGMETSSDYAQNSILGGKIEMESGQWGKAEKLYQKALGIIRKNKAQSRAAEDYRLDPLSLSVLNEYNDFLFQKYLREGDEELLESYDAYVKLYLELSNRLRLQFVDPYSRSIISKDNAENYSRSFAQYHYLYRQTANKDFLQSAYGLAEYGRTTRLRDLQSEKIRSYAMLPDSLLEKERRLKKEIGRLSENSLSHPDSSQLASRLFEAKEELNRQIEFTRKNYPDYHKLKYQSEVPDLGQLQQKLRQGENLLQFMQGDTAYYLILVKEELTELFEVGKKDEIDQLILQWRKEVVSLDKTESGERLYSLLWKPLAQKLTGSRITIIPDGMLYYLSFEALPTDDGYLIQDYNISYALSSSLWHSSSGKKSKGKVLAIAPGFEDRLKEQYREQLDSLNEVDIDYLRTLRQPWSLRYVKELKDQFANFSFTGMAATESRVKEKLAEGKLIYFGTHAVVEPEDPLRSRLVLAKELGEQREDGYLHAYEIYGIPLKAELAILSACESGIGQLKRGEGMLSLAYSMHYAGCPSTAVSLWKVDERVNTRISKDFLKNLDRGLAKSEALRRAKLDFLAASEGPFQHPFYWAGMVLMGEDGSVDLPSKERFSLLGIAIFSFLTGLIIAMLSLKRKK